MIFARLNGDLRQFSAMNFMSKAFRPPVSSGIMGRKSTITSAFVRALIPDVVPTEEEFTQALDILGQTEEELECSYCGGIFSEWDHFQPVVEKRKPTGHLSTIQNLVPCCGKCNQSKGNRYWKDWMYSDARLSPKSREVEDIDKRRDRLKLYEEWAVGYRVRFEELLTRQELETHWKHLEEIVDLMARADEHAEQLKNKIHRKLRD